MPVEVSVDFLGSLAKLESDKNVKKQNETKNSNRLFSTGSQILRKEKKVK